jgi:hypothetical protein
MMDQGYLKTFLKFVGYTFLAVGVFIVLLFATQDENEIEDFFSKTNFTEQIYDYWDWERYTEDFVNVSFNGYVELFFTGDTTGLNIDPRYFQFVMENAYKEYLAEATPYINFNNLELVEENEQVGALFENATDEQTGVLTMEINCRYLGIGPVLYKVITHTGYVGNEGVYESVFINLGSAERIKFQRSMEHGIDREMKSWAKRFYKMQQNEERLEDLYHSIYTK